ncbi:LacI family DNA-binding transcriptional regulator [Flavobacterium capsici]|uniref:LacI family DNA-binding transcriptional regulator n=1 Tax=Flavobacterium capsici TaxID=3075618 RepID=A0AA96F091_9FLAO|nr:MULTISPECIES: LacI family DNA-binding transcriptional regulator [unclassified Flavobacterium]WNM17745.1 LacI family DNA-binding transcriptional regulator [Flavobacterium sp. PMR2A8]WNM21798.1 LacI family DNA-binding transcriptional regulator [Flavobacterium sp. PMTSA4]
MSPKATIYDIAKELNISAATVSRALNNNPKISESTCKLVIETAARMNYKQNKLAQALKSGKSHNIGVIVPRIDSNFFASIIRGIEEELYPHKYNVIICQTHEDEKREIENINTLLNTQVDGILMSVSNMSSENDRVIEKVLEKKVPVIFFDRKKNIHGVSSVTINDFGAAYAATKHLIEQGSSKIAYFTGDRSLEIYENRFNGYKQALIDSGLNLKEDYVIQTKSNVEAGKMAVKKLLKLKDKPDAIFSASDFAALGAIQELKSQGIRIPEDFCVVGFGNEPFTEFMELSISSVDQNTMEMGKVAAQVFMEQINNTDKNSKIEKKVVLNAELLIRKSSSKESK